MVPVVHAGATVIRHKCRLFVYLLRVLEDLPGGWVGFVLWPYGSNHCRLLRFGWEQCGHGLVSSKGPLCGWCSARFVGSSWPSLLPCCIWQAGAYLTLLPEYGVLPGFGNAFLSFWSGGFGGC